MKHQLPQLPYELDALAPHISKETLEYHYGKHNQTYIDKLNALIVDSEFANSSLDEIVKSSQGAIFNNAAQASNHAIYWSCMSPTGGGEPSGDLASKIDASFGSFEAFKTAFNDAAVNVFGSGWAWLVLDANNSLTIQASSNANTPVASGKKVLLNCDMWEHSYYIDYRNSRPNYMNAFWSVVNWEFVAHNLHNS